MSQPTFLQHNNFCGEIYNVGGTLVAGATIHSGGGNIYFGSRFADTARKDRPHLLEEEGLCLLSLGKVIFASLL
jgi:hypothetical protein